MTSIVKPKIHESRIFASIPPACLNGIDVHTRAGITEHELFRSASCLSIINPEDDVVHGNRSSLPVLLLTMKSVRREIHVFPLQTENLTAPHARVRANRDNDECDLVCQWIAQTTSSLLCDEPLSTGISLSRRTRLIGFERSIHYQKAIERILKDKRDRG